MRNLLSTVLSKLFSDGICVMTCVKRRGGPSSRCIWHLQGVLTCLLQLAFLPFRP